MKPTAAERTTRLPSRQPPRTAAAWPGSAALVSILVPLLAGGCATTGECTPPVGERGATPAQVAATGRHTGEIARWGGVLVEARNLPDTTELEVVGYPVDRCGEPRTGAEPVGRFMVVKDGYVETADYPPGTRVSATGLIVGTREGQVGRADYRFPVLQAEEIRWWRSEPRWESGGRAWPWITIGVGGGSGGVGGGVGVAF